MWVQIRYSRSQIKRQTEQTAPRCGWEVSIARIIITIIWEFDRLWTGKIGRLWVMERNWNVKSSPSHQLVPSPAAVCAHLEAKFHFLWLDAVIIHFALWAGFGFMWFKLCEIRLFLSTFLLRKLTQSSIFAEIPKTAPRNFSFPTSALIVRKTNVHFLDADVPLFNLEPGKHYNN
jgi:hypothetical protein